MRAIGWLALEGWRSWWRTPWGWWVAGGWHLMQGTLFVVLFERQLAALGQAEVLPWLGTDPAALETLWIPWFMNLAYLLLMVCPLLGMEAWALPRRDGRAQLWFAAPLSHLQLVLGRWLGSAAVLCTLVLSSLWIPLVLAGALPIPWRAVAVGLGGLVVVGWGWLAWAQAVSVRTKEPALAFLGAFALLLVAWNLGTLSSDPSAALTQLAPYGHLVDAFRGALRLSDLSYGVLALAVGWAAAWAGLREVRP